VKVARAQAPEHPSHPRHCLPLEHSKLVAVVGMFPSQVPGELVIGENRALSSIRFHGRHFHSRDLVFRDHFLAPERVAFPEVRVRPPDDVIGRSFERFSPNRRRFRPP
jgi:hypothetical protein